MPLVVGLCKLGTTFCQQRCEISVYTAANCIVTVQKIPSNLNLRRSKVLTVHGHVLATFVSQNTCCLQLVFAAPRGDLKKQFLLYHTLARFKQCTSILPRLLAIRIYLTTLIMAVGRYGKVGQLRFFCEVESKFYPIINIQTVTNDHILHRIMFSFLPMKIHVVDLPTMYVIFNSNEMIQPCLNHNQGTS